MLEVTDLRIDLGHRVLLDGATFRLAAGEKVALVGPNGAGKTTLLRTIAGELRPAAGTIALPPRMGWLQQDVQATPEDAQKVALDHLIAAADTSKLAGELDEAQSRLEKVAANGGTEEQMARAVRRFTALEERFRTVGGYRTESEARRIAAGVGLDAEVLDRGVGTLSGGQRRRLELARLLFAGGDLLVLDEPTNHLDLDAKAWVMGFLRSSRATVLVVSHDIELLDDAIDRVLALDQGTLDVYKGTYTRFIEQRAAREVQRAKDTRVHEAKVAQLKATADRFRGGNANVARKAKNLDRRIERMSKVAPVAMNTRRRKIAVRFPDPPRSGDVVIEAHGLAKRYGDNLVFSGVDFVVGRGETFLVLGLNGAGKTSLLRIIAGVHEADAGSFRFGANVEVGFYAQEHEDIKPGTSVLDHMRERVVVTTGGRTGSGPTDTELRAILGHFGIVGDAAGQDAGTLSGGEKTKLALARLVVGRANLLLLDEPTNNLDVQSREAVLAALQHYKGTIVLVSHDTEFVASLEPDRVIVMPEGELVHFDRDTLELVELA